MNINKDTLLFLSDSKFVDDYNNLLNYLYKNNKLPYLIVNEKVTYNPKHYFRRTGSDPGIKTNFQKSMCIDKDIPISKFSKSIKGQKRIWKIQSI